MAVEPWCRTCKTTGELTRHSRATILDHITPLAEGGSNEDANLQPLCGPCHDLKTAKGAARARGAAEPVSIKPHLTIGANGWLLDAQIRS